MLCVTGAGRTAGLVEANPDEVTEALLCVEAGSLILSASPRRSLQLYLLLMVLAPVLEHFLAAPQF